VCDDDHCHAFFRQHAHRVEHFTDELRIESRGNLAEQRTGVDDRGIGRYLPAVASEMSR
jgi:hypothetical protein